MRFGVILFSDLAFKVIAGRARWVELGSIMRVQSNKPG